MKLKTAILTAAALALPLGAAQAQVAAEAAAPDAATAEAATTTATPATEMKIVAATPTDVKAGAEVVDTKGGEVGKIESVDANGAVIATGKSRVQIPLASFAKTDTALVIAMTKAELDAAASAKQPS